MKSLFELNRQLTELIKHNYQFRQAESGVINETINIYIKNNMLTESGRRRYPRYYDQVLHQVSYAVKGIMEDAYIIFGYWYKGEFYTTYRGGGHTHKTTKDLRKILPFSEWGGGNLESSMVYKGSLKLYTPKVVLL